MNNSSKSGHARPGSIISLTLRKRVKSKTSEKQPRLPRGKLHYLAGKKDQPRPDEFEKPAWFTETSLKRGKFIGVDGKATAFIWLEDDRYMDAANSNSMGLSTPANTANCDE